MHKYLWEQDLGAQTVRLCELSAPPQTPGKDGGFGGADVGII